MFRLLIKIDKYCNSSWVAQKSFYRKLHLSHNTSGGTSNIRSKDLNLPLGFTQTTHLVQEGDHICDCTFIITVEKSLHTTYSFLFFYRLAEWLKWEVGGSSGPTPHSNDRLIKVFCRSMK